MDESMKQYIDKSAVVAEIRHLQLCTMDEHMSYYSSKAKAEYDILNELLLHLDNLEVKEVDINKEISQFIDTNFEKATIGHKLSLRRVAKHFFELGLKAKGE